jgi:hypothetical protein
MTGLPASGELREMNESRQLNVSRRGMSGYRKFLCRWEEQDVLFTDTSPLGTGFPGYDYVRMVSYSIKPYGKAKIGVPGFEYDCALIECEYATLTGPDDAATSTWDLSCEVLETGEGRTWLSDATAIDAPVNLYLPLGVETVEYSVATSSIPALVVSEVGKVNSVEFRGYDAGRVLYDGFSSRNEWDADLGGWRSRIALKFIYRTRSHNEVWRGDLGDWDSTDPALYEETDLNALIPA